MRLYELRADTYCRAMLRKILPVVALLCACGAPPMTELEDDPGELVATLDGAAVVPAAADTFARDGFPAHVYGADAVLEIKKYDPSWNRTAYVRFPTSQFDDSFTKATLRAYGYYGSSPVVVSVSGTSTNWSESTLTWSNRPAATGGALATQSVSSSTPRWYEWDVTSYVHAQKALAQPSVAFALESQTYGNGIAYFSSKESGPNGPQLVVSGSVANPPPTVVTHVQVAQNPVTTTSVALSALGADDGGEASLTYTWSATYDWPVPVYFSENGTNAAKNTVATFSRAGTYRMQVSIADANGASVTDTLTVQVAEIPTTLRIEPENRTVFAGSTSIFIYGVYDQFGFYILPRPEGAVFTVSGGGTMTSNGFFTAQVDAGGPFTVTATWQGLTDQTTVNVYDGEPYQNLFPLADATVRSGIFASTNFGPYSQLQVKSGQPDFTRRALLSFDISSIPPNAKIKTADLRLSGATDGTPMIMSLYGIQDPWSESSVTWQNQPAATHEVSAFWTGQPYVKNYYSVEVVGYVREEHAAGHQILSIMIQAYTPERYFAMDSRESETPPSLDITFEF